MARGIDVIEQIKKCIIKHQNFILNGGAGSGKTKTLIDLLDVLYDENKNYKIACITFTNVAADEIKERVLNKEIRLRASTIHDFLWDVIKNYQKNIKESIIHLINTNSIKKPDDIEITKKTFEGKTINYRNRKLLGEGIISHDELLKIANYLFDNYSLLRRIISDKFDFILIDEYQDTEEQVIKIFLKYLQRESTHPIIGLFGDSMQSIYDKGIGSLQTYIDNNVVKNILKEDNWRSPISVVKLINQIRNDSLKQKPVGKNKDIIGNITFIYSNKELSVEIIKKHAKFAEFDFNNHKENKQLYLTHKLIAALFGFANLLSKYKYKDNVIGDTPDPFIRHLLKIQETVYLYTTKQYNQFIKLTDFKIRKASDKKTLKNKIEKLCNSQDKVIAEIIEFSDRLNLIKKDDKIKKFISENNEQYEKMKSIKFSEIISLYNYRNEYSPYSTQHGVKGAEYDNVFIMLDNGKWTKYNFKYMFENTTKKEKIVNRTRKLFYVCCSRVKKNLVVYYYNPSLTILDKAKEWFGDKNVIGIN